MAESDRKKWNAKYLATDARSASPPEWLTRHLAIMPRGSALDIACGCGTTAIDLARRGWQVTGIDISEIAIAAAAESARNLRVPARWIVADLDYFPLPPNYFDVVTIFNYLDRQRLPGEIVRTLRPGGMLVFETYTVDQVSIPGNHMSNPNHMLRPAELLTLFCGLFVHSYREIAFADRAIASIIGTKEKSQTSVLTEMIHQ